MFTQRCNNDWNSETRIRGIRPSQAYQYIQKYGTVERLLKSKELCNKYADAIQGKVKCDYKAVRQVFLDVLHQTAELISNDIKSAIQSDDWKNFKLYLLI